MWGLIRSVMVDYVGIGIGLQYMPRVFWIFGRLPQAREMTISPLYGTLPARHKCLLVQFAQEKS